MEIVVIRIFIILYPFLGKYLIPFLIILFWKKSISFEFMMYFCDVHFLNIREKQIINLFSSENKNLFFVFKYIKIIFYLMNNFTTIIVKLLISRMIIFSTIKLSLSVCF